MNTTHNTSVDLSPRTGKSSDKTKKSNSNSRGLSKKLREHLPPDFKFPHTVVETTTETKTIDGKKVIVKKTIRRTIRRVPKSEINEYLTQPEEKIVLPNDATDDPLYQQHPYTKKIVKKIVRKIDADEFLDTFVFNQPNKQDDQNTEDTQNKVGQYPQIMSSVSTTQGNSSKSSITISPHEITENSTEKVSAKEPEKVAVIENPSTKETNPTPVIPEKVETKTKPDASSTQATPLNPQPTPNSNTIQSKPKNSILEKARMISLSTSMFTPHTDQPKDRTETQLAASLAPIRIPRKTNRRLPSRIATG